MTRIASCSCGQLTAACEGEPVRRSICHCLDCQRRTGSAFGVQARWPREAVTIGGRATQYTRISDDGNKVTSWFCPNCGSTVYYGLEGLQDFISVAVGAFADPHFPAPVVCVYEERKHNWVAAPAAAEHMR